MRDNGLKKTQCDEKNNRMDDEILQVYLKVYGLETNNIIEIDIEFEIGEAFL